MPESGRVPAMQGNHVKSVKRTAPMARAKPVETRLHGVKRVDDYSWLQDAKNPEVVEYLKTENAYAERLMRPTMRLQAKLYKEIRSRIKENDMSVPVKDGPYLYYSRTKRGKENAIHCRRKGTRGKEEIILDENELAKHSDYFSLGSFEVSPDHTLLAYTTDVKGDEDHTLFVKDLATGELRSEKIQSVGDLEWSEDGAYIFYSREEHPHPPRRVYRHALGEDPTNDTLIYEEKDLQWYVSLGKSRSREFIFIYAANYTTTEARFIPARLVKSGVSNGAGAGSRCRAEEALEDLACARYPPRGDRLRPVEGFYRAHHSRTRFGRDLYLVSRRRPQESRLSGRGSHHRFMGQSRIRLLVHPHHLRFLHHAENRVRL